MPSSLWDFVVAVQAGRGNGCASITPLELGRRLLPRIGHLIMTMPSVHREANPAHGDSHSDPPPKRKPAAQPWGVRSAPPSLPSPRELAAQSHPFPGHPHPGGGRLRDSHTLAQHGTAGSSRQGSAPADKRFAAETQAPLSNRGVPCSRRQGFPLQLRGSAPPDLASAGRVASLRGRLETPLLDFRNSIYQTAESCSPRLPVDLVGCRRDPPSF